MIPVSILSLFAQIMQIIMNSEDFFNTVKAWITEILYFFNIHTYTRSHIYIYIYIYKYTYQNSQRKD